MSVPAIAQGPTPPPSTTPAPASKTPPSAPDTPTSKALAQAQKDNRRVEIESLRSENATYYANPDGKTVRMEQHLQPIRVKNAKGDGFTPVDTTLVETDGVIKPKAVKDDLTLSAGDDAFVVKSKSAKGSATIGSPGKLPEPTISGSTATYPSVYGDGIDLVVTATPTGFKQEIVLRERITGPVSFRIPTTVPKKMALDKDTAGKPTLLTDGKKVADLPPALLLDSVAADPKSDIDAGKVGRAAVTLDKGASALVYTPDPVYLADPEVDYPVTLAAFDDDWWEPELGNDTFVNNADYPNGYANSGLDRILVGKSNSGTVRWRSYIRFDEFPDDHPIRGATIQNADLVLWNHLSSDCGLFVGSGITAYQVTERWDVTTLTWGSQPRVTLTGADTEYAGYAAENCPGSMNYPWDLIHSVDEIVQAWADGEPNYGFQLTAGNESDLRNWRRYRTNEAGGCTLPPRQDCLGTLHPPFLTVDYTPVPEEYLDVAYLTDSDVSTEDTYEADLAQLEAGKTGDEPDAVTAPDAETVQAQIRSSGVAYESELMEQGHPEGLTDEQIELGSDPNRGDETPPASTPTPHPTPTEPVTPDKVLNSNPSFESAVTPWTASGGVIERSTERAHGTGGTASARLTTDNGATETIVRSESDIPISDAEFYSSIGWFYSPGRESSLEYGIEWLDGSGQVVGSNLVTATVPADAWTEVKTSEWPQTGATAARLVLRIGEQQTPVQIFADELTLLGPGEPPPAQGEVHTVVLPIQEDAWIDNVGGSDAESDVLYTGAWKAGGDVILERSYLRFDSTAVTGKTVTEAKLSLWNDDSYGCGSSQSGITVQQVTTAWNANSLSWYNKPADTTSGEATATDPGGCDLEPPVDVAWSWPVTGIVQHWANGQNNGLVLKGVEESDDAPVYDRGFLSSRGVTVQHRPTLTVTYIDAAGPTPTTPPEGPDTTPPSVVETSPADWDEDVSGDASITVRFSEAVQSATLTLYDEFAGQTVTGRMQLSEGARVLTFTPTETLDGLYSVELSDVKDLAGNAMPSYSWYFITNTWSEAASSTSSKDHALKVEALRVRGGDQVKGTLVVSTVEPHLVLNVDGPPIGRPTVDIEVAHQPDGQGEGTIWRKTVKVKPGERTVSVEVPPAKLKNGWDVRWRARPSKGNWTSWNSFTVGTPEKAAAPIETMDVLPSTKSWPEDIKSWSECFGDNDALSKREEGWLKNRFNWCQVQFFVARKWVKKGKTITKVGELKGWTYIRATSELHDREFGIYYLIQPTVWWGALANANIELLPNYTSSSGNPTTCRAIPYGLSSGNVGIWGYGNGDQDWDGAWEFRSSYNDNSTNKIERCVAAPAIRVTAPKFNKTTKKNKKIIARCDSSTVILWYRAGGCVLEMGMPILHMSRDDQNEKGDTWPEQYDHIYNAVHKTTGTYPLPGGVNFPNLSPYTQKNIPGSTLLQPLSRLTNKTAVGEQRDESVRICRTEIRKEWPGSIKKYGNKALNCDEYPFASTYQGSLRANPGYNFSVKLINARQNQKFGSSLGAWYENNRILDGDDFILNLYTHVGST